MRVIERDDFRVKVTLGEPALPCRTKPKSSASSPASSASVWNRRCSSRYGTSNPETPSSTTNGRAGPSPTTTGFLRPRLERRDPERFPFRRRSEDVAVRQHLSSFRASGRRSSGRRKPQSFVVCTAGTRTIRGRRSDRRNGRAGCACASSAFLTCSDDDGRRTTGTPLVTMLRPRAPAGARGRIIRYTVRQRSPIRIAPARACGAAPVENDPGSS